MGSDHDGSIHFRLGCWWLLRCRYVFALSRFTRSLRLWATLPVYQSETVPKQLRGTLIATYQLRLTAGILVAYCISIGTRELGNSGSWRMVIALGVFFAMVLGVGIMFVSL